MAEMTDDEATAVVKSGSAFCPKACPPITRWRSFRPNGSSSPASTPTPSG